MDMNPTMRRLIKWAGYPLFALFVFVVFVYVTFPYGKLKSRIEEHMAASGELEVSIEDLGPSPLTGLSAEGVLVTVKPKPAPHMIQAPPMGGAEGEAAPKPDKPKPLRILLEEVVVKAGLIAMLRGAVDVAFEVTALGGQIEGSYTAQKKTGWSLRVDAEQIKLDQLPAVKEVIGLPVAGTLSLKVDLKVPQNRLSNASGSVELECDGCAIGDGKAKLKVPGNPMLAMGIKMPRVRLGRLGGQVQVENGEATLSNVSAKSPDIQLKLEGGFSLRNPVGFSSAQAYLQFKISQALKKRDPKFELLESGLNNAKRSDGFYGMRVVGTLKSLRFVPSRLGPPKAPRRPGTGPGGPGGRPYRRFPAHSGAPRKKSGRSSG